MSPPYQDALDEWPIRAYAPTFASLASIATPREGLVIARSDRTSFGHRHIDQHELHATKGNSG
eukprot:3949810-Pleurochrysis_carterae.AAC.1